MKSCFRILRRTLHLPENRYRTHHTSPFESRRQLRQQVLELELKEPRLQEEPRATEDALMTEEEEEEEAKLVFVVRIRGINQVPPKVKKILRLLRLLQINNGVALAAV